jgi:hypothetical protein
MTTTATPSSNFFTGILSSIEAATKSFLPAVAAGAAPVVTQVVDEGLDSLATGAEALAVKYISIKPVADWTDAEISAAKTTAEAAFATEIDKAFAAG